MDHTLHKFPSIESFRHVVKAVADKQKLTSSPLPKLDFVGTVKLHGTNAAVCFNVQKNEVYYQSRTRILSLGSDNNAFMLKMSKYELDWKSIFNNISVRHNLSGNTDIVIYGEWAGAGIQKGVGINELPPSFYMFGTVKIVNNDNDTKFYTRVPDINIPNVYNINQFKTYFISIDFANPDLYVNELVNNTNEVETECPVAKHFGTSGIGEGIVYKCETPGFLSSDFWFKVKGEKHSVTKVKKLHIVDEEAVKSIKTFIDATVTENRLEQGLDYLTRELQKPMDKTSIGDFIRWVYNDIIKEEHDLIVEGQLNPKQLGGPISIKCKQWYLNKLPSMS